MTDEYKSDIVTISELKERNEKLTGLLKVAKCPACDGSGPVDNGAGGWDQEQCQWCHETKELID